MSHKAQWTQHTSRLNFTSSLKIQAVGYSIVERLTIFVATCNYSFISCLAKQTPWHYYPDRTTVKVNLIGTLCLENGLILKELLYVPSFKFNLVSVSKLIKDMACNVIFSNNACYLQEQLIKKPLLRSMNILGFIVIIP